MKTTIPHFLIVFLLFNPAIIHPQTVTIENYNIEQLTAEKGIPGTSIREIIQDDKGFLWMGTHGGLARYDGHNVKLYQPETSGLKNTIFYLSKDSGGYIWCGTLLNGIFRFDPRTEQFKHFKANNKNPNSLSSDWGQNIQEDKNGNFWIGTQRGLNLLELGDSIRFRRIFAQNYPNEVYEHIKKLEPIIAISSTPNNAIIERTFSIDKDSTFLLVAMGELNAHEGFNDYGLILDENRDTIWKMDPKDCMYAGCGKNVVQIDSITISPGKYHAIYTTDSTNAFGDWEIDVPNFPEFWGLQVFSLHRKELLKFMEFVLEETTTKLLPSNGMGVTKDNKGQIWIWADTFFSRINIHSEDSRDFSIETFDATVFPSQKNLFGQIRKILHIENDDYWILGARRNTSETYLARFNANKREIIEYEISPKVYGLPLGATVDQNGDFWLGIWGSNGYRGELVFDESRGREILKLVSLDLFDNKYLFRGMNNYPWSSFIDHSNNLWLGTWGSGAFKIDLNARGVQFYKIKYPNLDQFHFSRSLKDKNGELWVGTWPSEGLQGLFQISKDKLMFLDSEFKSAGHEHSYAIPLFEEENGIWFGIHKGLSFYNYESKDFSNYYVNEGIRWGTWDHITSGLLSRNNIIWLGMQNGQLIRFDPAQKSFTLVRKFAGDLGAITALKEDDTGDIWFGTGGMGLFKFDPIVYNQGTNYSPQTVLSSEKGISTIYKAVNGDIWVSTFLDSLYVIDPKLSKVKDAYLFESWPGGAGGDIAKLDDEGNPWIISGNGVFKFLPKTNTVQAYSSLSRVRNYNPSPNYLGPNGELLLTTHDGVFIFHPNDIQKNTILPKMAIIDILVNNEHLALGEGSPIKKVVTYSDEITFKYNQNSIAIEYVGIHFSDSEKNQYAYQLVGLIDEWVYVGKERIARFPDLSPGNYTFRVKAANADGVWNEDPATLRITILPPWWRTWWAYTLYTAFIVGAMIWFYRFQLKSRLDAVEKERLAELDIVKSRLYTNITHEFRTPLTIILGMADNARNNPKDWFAEGLKMIKHNGQRLLLLVNQMLDLAKLESGSMALQMVQGNVIPFLAYITQSFQSFAISKNVRLHFLSKESQLMMDYDNEKWLQLLSNLISNAVKHTPKDGDIYVQTEQVLLNQKPYLNIAIRDTGNGIPPDKLPTIFDRFQQGDDSSTRQQEGTGIGLALTKELVTLLGGEISVKSEVGRGATFIVALPIRNEAPLKDEPDMAMVTKTVSPFIVKQTIPNLVPEPISGPGDKPILLIIEDNLDVITYLQSCLPSTFQIEVATDGQMGIEKALEIIPDIIISDVMMPEKDGFEVVDTLKQDERTSHVPILLLTAKADIESKLEGLERGADAYLAKPFNAQELNLSINNLMTLLQKLRRRYASQILPLPTQDKNLLKEDVFVQKVRRAIEQNLDKDDWKVPHLASAVKLSREQLYRKLMALTDLSPSEYIRRMRLERGKELLETTDLQVSEIAYQVGFKEPAHFSNAFKELYGIPPGAIRK